MASRSIRDITKTRLERVLQWQAGLVDDILAGTATDEQIMDRTHLIEDQHQVVHVVDAHRVLQGIPPLALASLTVARLSVEPRTKGNRAAVEALVKSDRSTQRGVSARCRSGYAERVQVFAGS